MDERFFLYSEEIDWCYRFWEAGWPVAHLPVMVVTHHAGGRSTRRSDGAAQPLPPAVRRRSTTVRRGGRASAPRWRLGHLIRIAVFGAFAAAPSSADRARTGGAGRPAGDPRLGASAGPVRKHFCASRVGSTVTPGPDDRYYLEERYRGENAERSRALAAYYAVKGFLPRRMQIAMRRLYARRQARTEFPRWPIEPVLVDRRHAELRRLWISAPESGCR